MDTANHPITCNQLHPNPGQELLSDHDEGENQNVFKSEPRADRLTLAGALKGHDTFDGSKDDLWRLLCYLRIGNGCDGEIVKGALLDFNFEPS